MKRLYCGADIKNFWGEVNILSAILAQKRMPKKSEPLIIRKQIRFQRSLRTEFAWPGSIFFYNNTFAVDP